MGHIVSYFDNYLSQLSSSQSIMHDHLQVCKDELFNNGVIALFDGLKKIQQLVESSLKSTLKDLADRVRQCYPYCA